MTRLCGRYGAEGSANLSWLGAGPAASIVALVAALGVPGRAAAQHAPTFTQDVAPILFDSCARCHQPNGIGPMSLLSYDQVKPYVRRIRQKVADREMPPWRLDKTVGIQSYKNDISLSDDQIHTVVQWIDDGAPEGDPSALPPVPDLPDGRDFELASVLGPPDFVVKAPPYTVRPNAQDQWWTPTVPFKGIIDKPRYVRATEMRGSYPLGRRVLHHGHAQLTWVDADGHRVTRPLGRQGIGKGGDLFPEGTGMLIAPEGQVSWNLHYFPIDQEVPNEQAETAVWLYPEGYVPEYETVGEQRFTADMGGDMPWAGDIVIPPNSIRVQQGVHVIDRPVMITSFRPHMHMRGRAQSIEAIYPDGHSQMLARVNNYNHFWQISYEFSDDVAPLLPKGTVLLVTSMWDNTANNPINPDPRQWVVFGERGVDEMSHVWLGMTYLTDEQFAKLSAQRARVASLAGDN
jgi:mono/diheme cytochrome c family protein